MSSALRISVLSSAVAVVLAGCLACSSPALAGSVFDLAQGDEPSGEEAVWQDGEAGPLSILGGLSAGLSAGEDSQVGVVHEAAGVALDLPDGFEVIEVPGVFVVGSCGDVFVALTQADHDFSTADGPESLAAYLDERADGGAAVFSATLPADGTPIQGCTREAAERMGVELYIPVADGSLASLWLECPVDGDGEDAEMAERVYNSLRLGDGVLPVADAVALQEEGGLLLDIDGLVYDDMTHAWYGEDCSLAVSVISGLFSFDEGMAEDDVLDDVASIVDGAPMARCVLDAADGTLRLYAVAAVDVQGFLELACFAVPEEGDASLIYALCDASDAEATDSLGRLLASVEPAQTSPSGVLGSLLDRLGVRADQSWSDVDDLGSLLFDPAFVEGSTQA